ncbi:MAG TPA: FlgD immunoglobulin-like domain containing protein, partial [Ignavibacteriales bacterium]|nr:FlgD immunoglobulin-like domain containing protein [Ignavibacteriales bacterium]
PNPFNPTTNIKFSVAAAGKVSLVIYDVLGKRVKTLVDDLRGAGEHTIVWNGKDNTGASVASGIYFYQIKTQNYVKTMKMMLLK